jgi:hypothetical protein
MNELTDLLIYFLIGWFAFKIFTHFVKIRVITQADLEEQARERLEQLIHVVKQEQHQDMYYWFDRDTDEFLVQGRNDEEIRKALQVRFHNHIFVVDDDTMLIGPEFKMVKLT